MVTLSSRKRETSMTDCGQIAPSDELDPEWRRRIQRWQALGESNPSSQIENLMS